MDEQIPPPAVSKPFPLLLVILSILVLLSLSSTAYLAYQNMQLQKQITQLQTIPSPTPTSPPVPTTTTFQGAKYTYSFSYPSYFTVEPQTSTYSKEERVNFRNTTTNSLISLLEFRAVEGYWLDPSTYSKSMQVGDHMFWYFADPTYSDNKGLVVAMAQKGKELIYEFRFNGAKDFNDPVIQKILSTFQFNNQDTYTCPANGWVDCMPGPDVKPECSPAAMSWYKANCPDFKGGAL